MKKKLVQLYGAKFDPTFNSMVQQVCRLNDERYRINWDFLWLQQQSFEQQKWDIIFCFLRQINWREIHIMGVKTPGIIDNISLPYYTNLRILYLTQNRIQNMEAINFLNMENIQEISLNQNKIAHSKTMAKLSFPALQMFLIGCNKLTTLDWSRIYFQKFEFFNICCSSLVYSKDTQKLRGFQELSSISKLKKIYKFDSQLSHQKYFQQSGKIDQAKLWKCFNRKMNLKENEASQGQNN